MRRKDDLQILHDNNIYVPKRFVTFIGEVDDSNVENAAKNIIFLDTLSDDPIILYLNTPGGDVYSGLALYDTIKACRSHVTILATGSLMSMGTIILQAADERHLTPNCRTLLHHGWAGAEGNYKDFVAAATDAKALAERTSEILLAKIREKKPRYTSKQLDKLLTVDKYMWPKEFVDMGLADKIVGEE